jgi:serine/threonine protein kinase
MSEPPPSDRARTVDFPPPQPPGPPVGGSEAPTLAPEQAAAVESFRIVSIPGFEILGELGRGAMGVVYRARQLKLNRTVALKMILAGDHAGEGDRSRFRAEAEAIAQLQHPHIVQVYDIGEHEGRPYLALEYCPGGSLADRLDGTPWTAGRAAGLVETLARAMHAAHLHHVVHRDLKPANVLIMEECGRGKGKPTPHERAVELVKALAGTAEEHSAEVTPVTPKVTDFGLAKKLDQAGQTQSGAILGTPSYMAPEQAGGRGKEVGPAADVYALGAILYELLTGRPPFRAATTFDTLMQVIHDEPVPPTQLQPRTPRDLETICLKCLQKDPRRRYETAEELADDLRRFLTGEPIRARPVGTLERVIKLVRRRPAVAGLVAGIVAALTAGTVVSWHFAVEADKRANAADASALAAIASEKKAREKEELEKRARAEVEETLARSLLRPLGHQEGAPNDIELEALWELADSKSERTRFLFIESAFDHLGTSRQLRNRRDMAVQAVVCLDRARRDRIEEIVLTRLRDGSTDSSIQEDCAWVGLEVARPNSGLAKVAARVCIDRMAKERSPRSLRQLAELLAALAEKLVPGEAAQRATEARQILAAALAGKTIDNSTEDLFYALTIVTDKLLPAEAARQLADMLAAEKESEGRRHHLAQALSVVAARLEPAVAAQFLMQAMANRTNDDGSYTLAKALADVAARMDKKELSGTAKRYYEALAHERNPWVRVQLANGVAKLSSVMSPAQVEEAARLLAETLAKETVPAARYLLATALAAATAGMEPAGAKRLLAEALASETDLTAKAGLAYALSMSPDWVEPGERSLRLAEAARLLTDALGQARNEVTLNQIAESIASVAARMEPAEAEKAAGWLSDALAKEKNSYRRKCFATSLTAVTERMDATAAARCAAQAAQILTEALATERDSSAQAELAFAVSSVATRMEPAAAARQAAQVARLLTETGAVAKLSGNPDKVAHALTAVAGQMEPPKAARLLVGELARRDDAQARCRLASGLPSVVTRMEPVAAARLLTDALAEEKDPSVRAELTLALSSVARDEPADVARLFIDALARRANWERQRSLLVESLRFVFTRQKPEAIGRRSLMAAQAVAAWMSPLPPPGDLGSLLLGSRPLESHFSTQEFVDLLKAPTCVGPARRVILDQIGQRYHRTFADQWEFVEFAEKNLPDIDLLSPPKRPRK